MLKAMIEKITELTTPKTYEVDGCVYSSKALEFVQEKHRRPEKIMVTGLDSICKLVRNEAAHVDRRIFIRVCNPREVTVFTTLDNLEERFNLYGCTADTPSITIGKFMPYENAIIELRSLYIPNDDHDYLLQMLSSISKDSKVSTSDNGVTQTVEAKAGIALSQMVPVRSRVTLRPFRTFVEVGQPESEFLLRINDHGEIGLFPADGGVWKLEATRFVAEYFENELKDMIESGDVVVLR